MGRWRQCLNSHWQHVVGAGTHGEAEDDAGAQDGGVSP